MLKQLKLQAELKTRKSELNELQTRKADFEKRQTELGAALTEAVTDEDIKLVEEKISELDKEVTEAGIEDKMTVVNGEITRIEGELSEIDERGKTNGDTPKKTAERGKIMGVLQTRELMKTGEYYERAEVKEFYEKFKNLRAVSGEGLTIPPIIIDRIMDIVGDCATLYPLIDKIKVKGTARILIDTDSTAATWIEQPGTLPNGDAGTITSVDFDGYKIGKVTFVDNYILQDSIINVDAYVTKKLARAIALGLDLAILKGEGSTKKQPEGIITKLAANHKVDVIDGKLIDIVKPIALIDTGEDTVGTITAVVNRTTYYNRLLGFSINTNWEGNIVGKLPNIKKPDLLLVRLKDL